MAIDPILFVNYKKPTEYVSIPAKYLAFTTKRAFGVELEFESTVGSKNQLAKAINEVDEDHSTYVSGWGHSDENDYWHVKDDSSCGWEVASYKASGVNDLLNIGKVVKAIKKTNVKVSDRCGFHVHVEVNDFDEYQVAKLVAIWMKIEKVIMNMVPKHRVNNKFCRLLNEYNKSYKNKSVVDIESFWKTIRPRENRNYNIQRRVALNIYNYIEDYYRQTVEFRFPEGTIESYDVVNWIRLFVHFVNYNKQTYVVDTNSVNLSVALQLLGLSNNNFILSSGLRDTKEWFLHRILKYGSKILCRQAILELNKMWNPIRYYELAKDCSFYSVKE